jgi:hypothetical protein
MTRHAWLTALLVLVGSVPAWAADLTKVERRLVKEPAYKSGSPRYALLAFGPDARDRVWIVKDGDTLYVDRNGNGDLTDPGEKVAAGKESGEDGLSFEVGDLDVGGKKHYRLRAIVQPLKAMLSEDAKVPGLEAAVAKDPTGVSMLFTLDITAPHLVAKGTVTIVAGPIDISGPLVLAKKAADAPIIHLGGPLAVSFLRETPSLRRGRSTLWTLTVGTPGLGAGTFATIGYEGAIPDSAYPTAEVTYSPAKPGSPPVKKLYELKERC